MTHPDRRQLPPSYPDDVVAVMRDTITAQREKLDDQHRRLVEAYDLLLQAAGVVDEARFPEWWKRWRKHFRPQGAA
jgi:hypothetical protein